MMSLHLLVGIAVLLSAVEESTSTTSITLLECGGIKFQHHLYTQSEVPHAVEDTDLTFLIPWIDPSQVRRLDLVDYGIGAYVKKSYAPGEASETVIGHVFSRGNSQIYVPWETDNPGGFARLFFENYLLNTARRYRIIVLSLAEDSRTPMSNDSLHTLTRLMSIPAESSEVNLVIVGEQDGATEGFYNPDHHTNYIRNVIKSCKECALVSVRRWSMKAEEARKNFPGVPYVTSELGGLLQVLQGEENAKSQNMRSLACLQLDSIGDVTRSKGPYNGNIEGVYPYVPVTPRDDVPYRSSYRVNPMDGLGPAYAEEELLDPLFGLPPFRNKGGHNLRKSDVPPLQYEGYTICQGNVLLIYGDYFPLEINDTGCVYKTVLVRASVGLKILDSVRLPGKNLIIHTGDVIVYGDFTVDLSVDKCLKGYGGNFIMFNKKYYGLPLKIVTNGGKDCNKEYIEGRRGHDTLWNVGQRRALPDVARAAHPAGEMDLEESGSRMLGEGSKSRRKSLNRHSIEGKLKNIELEKGFTTSLSKRDLIQIFAGHVINDYSMDGKKVIQQARILSSLTWTGDDGVSRRMQIWTEGSKPYYPPPYIGPIDIGSWEVRSESESNEDWCFSVKVDDYVVECAIDFRINRQNEESLDLAQRLKDHSVAVEKCVRVDVPYVTEYDLFLCHLKVLDLSLDRNYIKMDDGLACYYDTIFGRKTLTCRVPRNVTDGDDLTAHALDIAWAVLTMRHMIINPLNMVRVSLRNFENNPSSLKLFSQLRGLYNETHKNLLRDLHNFFEDALLPKARDLLYNFQMKVGNGDSPPSVEEVADIICWTGFIRSKILVPPPTTQDYPIIFEDLISGTASPSDLTTIHHRLVEQVFYDFNSFMDYLKFLEGHASNYSEPLKGSLTAIINRFYEIGQNKTNIFTSKKFVVKTDDEDKIQLSEELLKIMEDFRSEVLDLKHTLDGQTLIFFFRTAGKFVEKQSEMLPVFDNVGSISGNETAWEYLLHFPMEQVFKLGTECKSLDLHLGFRTAFNKTKTYPKELYIAILENLETHRKALEDLPDINQFGRGIKPYARTLLDLEREVYKSLQAAARAEDIGQALDAVLNFDGDFDPVKPELEKMLEVMHTTLAYLIFKSATMDFEQRIFPHWEDVSSLFHPENIAQSLKELAKTAEGILSNCTPIEFDPKNGTLPVKPFFSWDAQNIGQKYLYDFFRGYYPLFLLARDEGEFPPPVKGYKFAVRFVPHANYTGNWLQRIKGTEVHIRPASFSYNFYNHMAHFTSSRSPRFNQVMGVGSEGKAQIPVSPYTLWRVRVRKIRVDFPETIIDRIELIGEGVAMEETPDDPQTTRSWVSRESYDDVLFTLPKRASRSDEEPHLHP